MNQLDFYKNYEIRLAQTLSVIERRGVAVDVPRLKTLREEVSSEIDKEIKKIAADTGRTVVLSKEEVVTKGTVVLQSSQQVVNLLQSLNLFPTLSRKSLKPSSQSSSLHLLLSESGSPVISSILVIRELGKLRSVYIDAPLHNSILYGSLKATGTSTGRRASSENVFRLGTNLQNLPKWSDWAKKYRSCLIARPGKIFLQCDQSAAEDWVINAIIADVSGDEKGIKELSSGVSRHKKLAGFLFGLPSSEIDKESIQYYLAKRVRYAGSYGMWKWTMAETLASEGKIIHVDECGNLLDRFHLAEPAIKGVFQKYVEEELRSSRVLVSPLGRRREFFALRPFTDNQEVFRKGYAFIPQSTVGDNTGMAIVYIEADKNAPILLKEDHDSTLAEVDDNQDVIEQASHLLRDAFNRKIHFSHGYEITIPIEPEIGYNLGNMVKCDFAQGTGWKHIYQELNQQMKRAEGITFGQLPLSSRLQ